MSADNEHHHSWYQGKQCLVGILACPDCPDKKYTGHPHCLICDSCSYMVPYHDWVKMMYGKPTETREGAVIK